MSSRRWMVAVGIALLVVATSGLVSAEETRAGGYAEESGVGFGF